MRVELQGGDGLWVPSVLDTVLAVVELSHTWQEVELLGLECLVVQADGITGDGLESDTADGAQFCSEVALQKALAQTDALEDLGTTIASDGRDTHLSHNLEQALLHSLDVVLLGCMVILPNLSPSLQGRRGWRMSSMDRGLMHRNPTGGLHAYYLTNLTALTMRAVCTRLPASIR